MQRLWLVWFTLFVSFLPVWAQSPTATIDGRVLDPSRAVIDRARVEAINIDTNVRYSTETNSAGLFTIVNLPPGVYRIEVSKPGFRTIVNPGIVLHVQDVLALNFEMPIGSTLESITVTSETPLVNTTDVSVSTVVDRNFAENLPLNGRSFQTLIQLTPGVVLTPTGNGLDTGQFSVNGQRASSNYWMVDGVGANIGVGAFLPAGITGTVGAFSAQGGTNSLVSVDALQEFRIQTSTYAPEFGRSPGAQISIVTRSGTNQFHGTAFDYFRNDVLDANDWFADHNSLPKPQERQNDFGGTFGGPIVRNRTFFFFSYEGLRLRLPEVVQSTVPDLLARQSAAPSLTPYLNAYPLPSPNAPDDSVNGIGEFNGSFSNRSTLNAYSIRLDDNVSDKFTAFGRYNYSPSQITQRGPGGNALSVVSPASITTQTATVGGTWTLSPWITDDVRFNFSQTNAHSYNYLDTFGGAVPLTVLPFPNSYNSQNAQFGLDVFSLANGLLTVGDNSQQVQKQINIVDSLSVRKDSHSLKLGVDYRRLTPEFRPSLYAQNAYFNDVPSFATGNAAESVFFSARNATLLLRNVGVYAQDTWQIIPRLSLTYGLRWELDVVPSSLNGPKLPAATGFSLNNFGNLALAPSGTSPFSTRFANLAPRVGAAYQISSNPEWGTTVRGGWGLFFDLATSEAGNILVASAYPFGTFTIGSGGAFPFTPSESAAPPIVPPGSGSGTLTAFDPHLRLPRTLEWNVALEQALGHDQSVSLSYVGASGRDLIQTEYIYSPNPSLGQADLIANTASSDYSALQIQYRRRLSQGLQALASYTWAHSTDTGSAGSYGNASNTGVPTVDPQSNRGPSDFDVRNAFTAGLTWQLPSVHNHSRANAFLGGWALQQIFQARSAPPVNVSDGLFFQLFGGLTQVRPDAVQGQPLYLNGSQYPGGKAFNPAAFMAPPVDPVTGAPLRQGDIGRNSLRGFGAAQWDVALHRDFPLYEHLTLQFRAELFNVLNHPNFGQPEGDIINPQFGLSTQTLGQYLAGAGTGNGSFSSLYQIGGSRSIQLALKLRF